MNTLKAAKLVRRSILPLAIVVVVWFYLSVGFLRVPQGMDTMTATHPEGSLCLIDKRSGAVQPGTVVFVDAFGGTVLTRVQALHDGFIEVRHDNPDSQLPSGEDLGLLPLSMVRGVVLAVFPPDPAAKDLPHGR